MLSPGRRLARSDARGYRGLLRLYGGYEFNRTFAAEAMTLDLGVPGNGTGARSTLGAIGIVAVGMIPLQRWRFSGRLGALSMDGRADGVAVKRSAQGMVALGVGFTITRGLIVGLETAVSRVEFGAPISETAKVNWTGFTASYRF